MGPAGGWAGQGEEPAGGQHRCPLLCLPAGPPLALQEPPCWGKPRKVKKTLTQKTLFRGGCFVHGAPVRQVGTLGSPSAHGGGHLLRGEGPLSPGLDLPHRIPTPLASHGIQTVLSLQKLGARVSSWPPLWSPVEGTAGNPSSGLGRARSRCGRMTASLQRTGEDTSRCSPVTPRAGQDPSLDEACVERGPGWPQPLSLPRLSKLPEIQFAERTHRL